MKTTRSHPGVWSALLLLVLARPVDGQTAPVAADGPPTAKSVATTSANPLNDAKAALEEAIGLMRSATANNKGGYVEKSRDDLDQSMAIMNEWLAYSRSHPEEHPLPPRPADAIDVLAARIAAATSSRFPNLQSTLKDLHAVLGDLQQAPGDDAGGFRSRLVASLDRAATDVIAGITYGTANAGNAGGARTITPLGPPANATAFYSGTMTVTKRLDLAQRSLEQTEAALRQPPTHNLDELAVALIGRDQALAACALARADVAAAEAYIKAYPANDELNGGAMTPEDPPVLLAALPPALDRNPAGRFTNPPVVAALDALNQALNALTNARPKSSDSGGHPTLPDLDGYRLKLMRDICQVQAAINAGFNETYDAYVAANTGPRRSGARGGLGN